MAQFPLNYIEPVFRPPSEAHSLLLQVTNGCSYNQCTFCDMYTAPQKKFKPKPEADVLAEIDAVAKAPVRKIFLADGDAMVLSSRRLTTILEAIQARMPQVERVSAYCLPSNIKKKSVEELKALRKLGLGMVYVGCESGDDEVLGYVNKGETFASSKAALIKLKQAGIKSSVMILNGLGGRTFSQQHAINSARLMNEAQPEYLSTLVVSFPLGEERFRAGFNGQFEPLSQMELFQEIRTLVEHLELSSTVFRSDHASNYLVLKGTLGADKARMLDTIDTAIHQPGRIPLRPEWMRGL
ncbi:MAG: B12-binding domain-containing radical SAM protein [Ketobacter sp.]|nr:B12-binding domain-containing radical SAM protein [Ketobacter sp.]